MRSVEYIRDMYLEMHPCLQRHALGMLGSESPGLRRRS